MDETHEITPQVDSLDHRLLTRNLRIRPSGAADRRRVQACFDALSPESRRRRFFAAKQSLTPTELDFFTSADGWDHIALAAIRLDDQGREREALGFARCIRLNPGDDTAEFAVTVADAAQGKGIGRALLSQLKASALAAGIRRLRCEVLADNQAMRILAERMGGTAHRSGDGTVDYECLLEPAPGPVLDLPWFADPGNLVAACTDRWLEALDDALTGMRTAQQEVAGWLADLCPMKADA